MKGIVLYDQREDTFTVAEHNVEDDGIETLRPIAQAVMTSNRGGIG